MYLISRIKNYMMTFNIKKLITALILLTFIGQALSIGFLSCEMHQSSQEASSSDPQAMNHAHHLMSDSMSDSMSATNNPISQSDMQHDCCDDELSCDMSGCMLPVLSYDETNSINIPISLKISSNSNLTINSSSKSLFRPPILS